MRFEPWRKGGVVRGLTEGIGALISFLYERGPGPPARWLRRSQTWRRWPQFRPGSGRPPGWEVRPGWGKNQEKPGPRHRLSSWRRRHFSKEPGRTQRAELFSARIESC